MFVFCNLLLKDFYIILSLINVLIPQIKYIKTMKILKILKKVILYTLLACLGLIIVAELFLRCFYHESLSKVRNPRMAMYQVDTLVGFTFLPNSEYVVPDGTVVRFNKDGYIGEDWGEKDSLTFRIAIIGDSFVTGNLINPYYSNFCIELQKLFDEEGYNVQILNMGVDGGERNAYWDYRTAKEKAPKYDPDIILMQFKFPMVTDQRVREYYKGYRLSYCLPGDEARPRLMDMVDYFEKEYKPKHDRYFWSHIYKAWYRFRYNPVKLGEKRNKWIYQTNIASLGGSNMLEFSEEESAEKIRELKQTLNEQGIYYFLFSVLDNPDYKAIALEHQFPYLDLRVPLSIEAGDYFRNDSHPNQQGSRKVAERIYEILTNNNLIPEKYKVR